MNAKKNAYVKQENEKSERTKESKKQKDQSKDVLSVDEQLDRFADLLLDIYLTAHHKNESE